ncbi:MAG: hypothetical protein WCW67_00900 [Candidatus Margulisiibacteriota bacterium]|jgi:hypothetical protein
MTKLIKIPSTLGHAEFDVLLEQQTGILLEGQHQGASEPLVFDFSENKSISVLGILFIAKMADKYKSVGYDCRVIPPKEKKSRWLISIMNLIKSEEKPKEMQKYWDTFRVPILRCRNSKESLAAVNKLIPVIRNDMKPSDAVLKALNWALWEIVDNAGVHGYQMYESTGVDYSGTVYFCAASLGENIDIAIIDGGQGIHSSFRSSGKEKYHGITNEEALKLSTINSESGHPQGSPGFGLFGCSEIARAGKGQLLIVSGSNKLLLSEKGVIIGPSLEYMGTMVSLRINRNAAINLLEIFGETSLVVNESINELIGGIDE